MKKKSGSSPSSVRIPALLLALFAAVFGLHELLRVPGTTRPHRSDQRLYFKNDISDWRSALEDLDSKIDGNVIFREDSAFGEAAIVWNAVRTMTPAPKAVVEVASSDDVSRTISVLSEMDLPFSIRSGGHNKAGYSNAPDGVIISLGNLNSLDFLEESLADGSVLARVGPAIHGPELLEHSILSGKNLSTVFGFCPGVAIGGFSLGGGWGLWSRKYGLGTDNIVSAEVVLANASIVEANESSHSELFWALRGAGIGNFGVVTAMTYKFHPTIDRLDLGWTRIPYAEAGAALAILAELETSGKLPGELCASVESFDEDPWELIDQLKYDVDGNPYREMGRTLGVSMMWACDETPGCLEKGVSFRKELAKHLSPNSQFFNIPAQWTDNPVSQPSSDSNLVASFTGFINGEDATEDNLSHLIGCYTKWIDRYQPYIFPDMELWGGAIGKHAANETSFPFRDAVYNTAVLFYIPEEMPELFEQIQTEFPKEYDRCLEKMSRGAYVNYQVATLEQERYLERYWGQHVPKLRAIKTDYDPGNLFSYEQSIPPLEIAR